ncbi:MAG: division/cell wall cluster transcriptional repressor MraZ [Rhodothermales bacterium]
MASFKGQAEYSVDSKGRVAIPAKMRNALSPEAKNSFTITRGFEQCINLYPLDQWEKREAEISELNTYRSEARDFVRTIMMWADEVTLDAQGRIVVPKPLLKFAGIEDQALIIGALDHIEIWNSESFEAYQEGIGSDYPTLAERVLGM